MIISRAGSRITRSSDVRSRIPFPLTPRFPSAADFSSSNESASPPLLRQTGFPLPPENKLRDLVPARFRSGISSSTPQEMEIPPTRSSSAVGLFSLQSTVPRSGLLQSARKSGIPNQQQRNHCPSRQHDR